jgi:hypothetical protein
MQTANQNPSLDILTTLQEIAKLLRRATNDTRISKSSVSLGPLIVSHVRPCSMTLPVRLTVKTVTRRMASRLSIKKLLWVGLVDGEFESPVQYKDVGKRPYQSLKMPDGLGERIWNQIHLLHDQTASVVIESRKIHHHRHYTFVMKQYFDDFDQLDKLRVKVFKNQDTSTKESSIAPTSDIDSIENGSSMSGWPGSMQGTGGSNSLARTLTQTSGTQASGVNPFGEGGYSVNPFDDTNALLASDGESIHSRA